MEVLNKIGFSLAFGFLVCWSNSYASDVSESNMTKIVLPVTEKWDSLTQTSPVLDLSNQTSPLVTQNLFGKMYNFLTSPIGQDITLRFGFAIGATVVSYFLIDRVREMMMGSQYRSHVVSKKDLITFKDYVGDIPEEVIQLVDQLKNPKKYEDLGIHVTKGILLYGPTGSGKTYLARAIAGEVNCPFIAKNGTDFVQSILGQSKVAVQTLFDDAVSAAKNDPSKTVIVFIDELDAIGSRTSINFGASANSTAEIINTLLINMDGFEQKKDINVVVIGATNLIENIDSAIRRSGRFDYKIEVGYPSAASRKKLIEYYLKKYKSDNAVSSDWLAEMTEGLSPADVNLVFESAGRIAAGRQKNVRDKESFEKALARIRQSNTGVGKS